MTFGMGRYHVRIDTAGGKLTLQCTSRKKSKSGTNTKTVSRPLSASGLTWRVWNYRRGHPDPTRLHVLRVPKSSNRSSYLRGVDLAALGLSPGHPIPTRLHLCRTEFSNVLGGATERYDLAKQKLQGRVLYWFLAGELRIGIKWGCEAFVDARWQSFEENNPFPEYTEALQAEMNKTLDPTTRATRSRFHPP